VDKSPAGAIAKSLAWADDVSTTAVTLIMLECVGLHHATLTQGLPR